MNEIFPWQQVSYLGKPKLDPEVRWLAGTWVTESEFRNGGTTPTQVATRRRDAKKRLVAIEVDQQGVAAHARVISLAYDSKNRLVRFEDRAANRLEARTYRYNSKGLLLDETHELTSSGSYSRVVAKHSRNASRHRISVSSNDKVVEDWQYDAEGSLLKVEALNPVDGQVWNRETFSYNVRGQETKRVQTQFSPQTAGGPYTAYDITEEDRDYKPAWKLKQRRKTQQLLMNAQWVVVLEEVEDYSIIKGQPLPTQYVQKTFNLNEAGQRIETLRITHQFGYDAQGQQILFVESGTNFETGQSKTNRTVTRYENAGKRRVETLDLGDDGTADEETITLFDSKQRIISTRHGTPSGPFQSLTTRTFHSSGELLEAAYFRDNKPTPDKLLRYAFS